MIKCCSVTCDISGYYKTSYACGIVTEILGEIGVMSEYFQENMFSELKNERGNCVDCNGPLTLYEEDFRKRTRVLVCERCGMLHLYTKSRLTGWKLVKVRKKPISYE